MADEGDGFGSQFMGSGPQFGAPDAPTPPTESPQPLPGGFGSMVGAAGSAVSNFGRTAGKMLGGPDYGTADPNASPLDQASDLLQKQVTRANQVARNPLLQIFNPEGVKAARDLVPKMTEQLQTIEQQRQRAADMKQTAQNWGLTNPNQFGPQATDTTLANEALRQWKDEGNFNAYKALSGVSPEWKNRADLYMPDAMSKFGDHVTAVQKGIQELDTAAGANSEQAFKGTRDKIVREHDLDSLGIKESSIPKTREEWAAKRGSLSAQYNTAKRTLDAFNVRQDQLNQATPVTDEKVAKRIEDNYQFGNTETVPGFRAVTLSGYGGVQGVMGPPGSRDTANRGHTWSNAAPEQVKTVREQLGAEEVKGALGKYKMAREFNETARNDKLYTSAAGIALLSDELGAIGRDVAEGSKAAGTVGLTKMLEAKYGTVDSARNRLNMELSALQEWRNKGGPADPRLSKPSIEGIKLVAQFKHDQALKEVQDRISQPLETAGRYGMPLKNLGIDKELIDNPILRSTYDDALRAGNKELDGYPMVAIGDRRVMLPTGSNVPGAKVAPLDHSAPGDPDNQPPSGARPTNLSSGAPPPGGTPNVPGSEARFRPQLPGAPPPGGAPSAVPPTGGTPSAVPPTGGSAPGRTGVPPGMKLDNPQALDAAANRTIQIESGFKPQSKTGSYVGYGQWSKTEMERHGITDPDNLEQTRAALKVDMQHRAAKLEKDGLPATAANVYLMHQQGEAGLETHLRNPDRTAWENIRFGFRTDAIAKLAVWGNMTADMRKQFGIPVNVRPDSSPEMIAVANRAVENVTSGDFTRLWEARYNGTDRRSATGAAAGARMLAGGGAEDALNSEQRTAPRYVEGVRRDVAADTTTWEDVRKGAVTHAPAIGSTLGALGGSLGGPVGTVAGGAAGGAGGQSLKDWLLGNPQSAMKIAKEGAIGGILGVVPEGRPIAGAIGRVLGVGGVEAGAKAAEGGDAGDIAMAGAVGAGAAVVGEGFGRALGMGMHKIYSLFTPSAQKSVRTAAADLHAANEVLKTEQPKLLDAAGTSTANPKYEAAQAAKEKAEEAIKEIMPNAKPDEVAYAHKVSSENVPRREAEAARPGEMERQRLAAGYEQLRNEVGAKGVGAPEATAKLPDGPIAKSAGMPKVTRDIAKRAETAITTPVANWREKWTQLQETRSGLLEAERDAKTSTAEHRSQTAEDMRTLADSVRTQQVAAAKAAFGPVEGPKVIERLKMLDTRYRRLMDATNGGDIMAAARLTGEAGRSADRAFRAFAQDDGAAVAAWSALRNSRGSDAEKDIRTMIGAEKIPVLGHLISAAKLAAGYVQWRAGRAAGSMSRFDDFVPELKGSGRAVRNFMGSVGGRAGVSIGENGL